MASILYIEEAVVTGDLLSRLHRDESEIRIADSAIVTPTGWDYLRQHRVQLSKGGSGFYAVFPKWGGRCFTDFRSGTPANGWGRAL